MKIKDIVTYQSGAVVSRTLVSVDGGTVSVFAFDEGHGLSAHSTLRCFTIQVQTESVLELQ